MMHAGDMTLWNSQRINPAFPLGCIHWQLNSCGKKWRFNNLFTVLFVPDNLFAMARLWTP